MKTKLTKEQSQALIDLGVPEKMASDELVEDLDRRMMISQDLKFSP